MVRNIDIEKLLIKALARQKSLANYGPKTFTQARQVCNTYIRLAQVLEPGTLVEITDEELACLIPTYDLGEKP
jgi:hypothetical protein